MTDQSPTDADANDLAPTTARVALGDLRRKVNPQRVVELLHRDLYVHFGAIRRFAPDVLNKVIKPLNRIRRGFRIDDLDDQSGFRLDKKNEVMILNRAAIEAMMTMVVEHPATLTLADAAAAAERLIETYALHELLHVFQNLSDFLHVQRLKKLASLDLLGILDFLADHDAARFVSAVHVARVGGSDRRRFLDEFLKTLVLVNEFAPRTFKCPADKPHKRRRFLGSVLVAALLNATLTDESWRDFESSHFSLETPLYPYFDVSTGNAMLLELSPQLKVLAPGGWTPPKLLQVTTDELDSANISVTMGRATEILKYLGLLEGSTSRSQERSSAV